VLVENGWAGQRALTELPHTRSTRGRFFCGPKNKKINFAVSNLKRSFLPGPQ